jgi:hypothetical protein
MAIHPWVRASALSHCMDEDEDPTPRDMVRRAPDARDGAQQYVDEYDRKVREAQERARRRRRP